MADVLDPKTGDLWRIVNGIWAKIREGHAVHINGYYANGAPSTCAFCSRPFPVLQSARQCFRGTDNRYYCSAEHAGRGQQSQLEAAQDAARRIH